MEGLLNPANYSVRGFTLLFPLLSVAIVLHHAWLLHREGLKMVHVTLALLGLSIVLWLTPVFFFYNALNEDLAQWWAKAAYFGIPFIPSSLYHFTVAICNRYEDNRKLVWFGWTASALFSALFVMTNLMNSEVFHYSWGSFPAFSRFVIPYLLFFWLYQGLSLNELWREWKRVNAGTIQHRRIRAFFFAFAIGFCGNIDYLTSLGVPVYPLGGFAVAPAFLIISWTITKYRLIDITPRFAAESIIETMNDSLIVLDEDGIIRVVNKGAVALLGYETRHLLGHDVFEIFPAETFKRVFDPENTQGAVRHIELPYRRPDGQGVTLDFSVSLMREMDRSIARICILRDVTQERHAAMALQRAYEETELRVGQRTADLQEANRNLGMEINERRMAEEALRKSEEKYRLVVENANDAIVILQDGKAKFQNHQVIILSGYSEEEIKNSPFPSFIHSDDRDLVTDIHSRRLEGENIASTYSFRFIHKTGETLWVQVNAVLITWEGSPAVLVFLRDITIQKKLEEQLLHARKMEAIGTLAGGIAHDFNNLLMGILGYTSLMLLKTDNNHPFHEKLKTIERLVESGAELTRQLLGFARGGRYEVKPVNVSDLIVKTSEIFGRTKKEITIHKKLQKDLFIIEADKGQIEQVLYNLYVNAWQAMPSGGSLYLTAENSSLDDLQCRSYSIEPGKYIKITVTDTGAGMDAETQKRIFEPFFSTKGIGKGTGLGLASAYGIVKNHGGIINVYSEKGHGTTFTLYLPASGTATAERKANEDTLFTGDETILLVDDESVNLETIKEFLNTLGYKILTAQSGKDAIELYRERPGEIQLVILDMIMPEMNGKETLMKLMELDKDVCVLLSSGYSINGEAAKILEMGCKGFIQKPFRIEELSRQIRNVLKAPS
jgi:two-component system, cell cycle sensor histidine kinase and response regulator CckA